MDIHKLIKIVIFTVVSAGFLFMLAPVQAAELNPPGKPVAVGQAVLQISRQIDPPHLSLPGSYTITDTVTNSGTATAYNVVISQDLTAGFSFDHEAKLTVKIGNIGASETVTRTSTIEVSNLAVPGRYSNDATVSATGLDPIETSAIIDVVKPAVLGAATTLAETGVNSIYMIIYLALGGLFIAAGLGLLRRGDIK